MLLVNVTDDLLSVNEYDKVVGLIGTAALGLRTGDLEKVSMALQPNVDAHVEGGMVRSYNLPIDLLNCSVTVLVRGVLIEKIYLLVFESYDIEIISDV